MCFTRFYILLTAQKLNKESSQHARPPLSCSNPCVDSSPCVVGVVMVGVCYAFVTPWLLPA